MKSKLEKIKELDALNREKGKKMIEDGTLNLKDLKIAAERLGKKMQSAFKTKK